MSNQAKIDIVTNEVTYEPMYQITMNIPFGSFEASRIYGLSRADTATIIGTQILDDVEAFIAKRKNEQLHTVTK